MGPAIVEWLETEDFGFQIVYLLRHPIAAAVSLKRGVSTSGGWAKARSKRAKPFPIKAAAYLVDEGFVRAHLTQPQVDIGWEVLRHGSLLSATCWTGAWRTWCRTCSVTGILTGSC